MTRENVHEPINDLDEDLLERQSLAKVILQKLASDGCPPTLGIYGSWGTGKSSLLNLICEYNAKEKTNLDRQLIIEIIDAWQYEVIGNLFIPVVKRLQGLISPFNSLPNTDAKTYLKRVLVVTGLAALNRFGNISPGDLQKFREVAEEATSTISAQDWDELIDEIDCTRQAFTRLIEIVINQQNARVVFCIDNLDRCWPDQVIHLFESIQNFLAVKGCVWVFAMDSEIVASYIQQKYQSTAMDGYSYLDKIISEQYYIPPPSLELDSEKLSSLVDRVMLNRKAVVLPTNWQKYARIPRLLVPRRLIKAARKYQEVYTNSGLNIMPGNPDITFALILLYQGWQDFYERLSSDAVKHVGGILANFEITKGYLSKLYPKVPIPLAYTQENLDLVHYLQHAFLDENMAADTVIQQITADLRALRQVGLP